MTGDTYKSIIEKLGMSQVGSAKFFGVDDTTVRRWVSDKTDIPLAVAMLLRVMVKYKSLTPHQVMTIARLDRVAPT